MPNRYKQLDKIVTFAGHIVAKKMHDLNLIFVVAKCKTGATELERINAKAKNIQQNLDILNASDKAKGQDLFDLG